MAHGPWKKRLDFGGNPDHVRVTVRVKVGLGLRLGMGATHGTGDDTCYTAFV